MLLWSLLLASPTSSRTVLSSLSSSWSRCCCHCHRRRHIFAEIVPLSLLLLLILLCWLPNGSSFSTFPSYARGVRSMRPWRPIQERCRKKRVVVVVPVQALLNTNEEQQRKEQDNKKTKVTLPVVVSSSALAVATTTSSTTSTSIGVVAGEPAGAHPLSSASTSTAAAAAATSVSVLSQLPAEPTLPSYRSLWVFTCTTMLIWLSEPMLSLVDTTVVGMTQADQMAAVVQLAALGPATMLIDASAYVAFFLGIATTNQLAIARAKNNIRKLQTTTSQVLGVAVIFGMAISMIVFWFGRPILTWMAGQSATPQLLQYSLQYCYIRAAVAPVSIMGLVAQSVCLADLDTMTPGYAVLVASVVNIVGDLSLVPKYGIAGAAMATAVAGVAATFILMRKVKSKMMTWRQREVDMHQAYFYHHHQQQQQQQQQQHNLHQINATTTTTTTNNAAKDSNATNVDAHINGTNNITLTSLSTPQQVDQLNRNNNNMTTATASPVTTTSTANIVLPTLPPPVPLLSLPDRTSFTKLVKLSGPIFFVMLGKIVCYSAMTLRATNFGILALAGHNIMMRIYWFMACFGDSLGQTAQSYLPSVLFYSDQKWRRQLIQRLLIMAVCIGLGVSQFAKWILQHLAGMFTKDAHIISIMSQQSTWMAFSLLLDPFIMLCEGCIIATRDLQFLVLNYSLTMGLLWALLHWTAQTSLSQVWRALFFFHGIRLFQFATRVYKTTLKEQKGATSKDKKKKEKASSTS